MPTPVAVAPVPVAAPVVKPVAPAPPGAKPPAPPTPDAVAAPAPPPPEPKIKLKVDGEMVEMTQAELERWASKGRFSDKATQEAKEAIKRAKTVADAAEARQKALDEKAKTDTDAWLREHGIDPDEYARQKLERKVQEGKMTQDQRDKLALEQENKRLKAEQEKAAADRKAEQTQQLTQQLQKRIENELASAAKRAGMTMGDESFFAIYQAFQEAFDLGLLPTDTGGLMPHHADRIIEEAQARLDGAQKNIRENALKLKGDALLNFVGEEAVNAIVNARLEQIRARRGVAARPPAPAAAPSAKPAAPGKYLTPSEADAAFKAAMNGTAR